MSRLLRVPSAAQRLFLAQDVHADAAPGCRRSSSVRSWPPSQSARRPIVGYARESAISLASILAFGLVFLFAARESFLLFQRAVRRDSYSFAGGAQVPL